MLKAFHNTKISKDAMYDSFKSNIKADRASGKKDISVFDCVFRDHYSVQDRSTKGYYSVCEEAIGWPAWLCCLTENLFKKLPEGQDIIWVLTLITAVKKDSDLCALRNSFLGWMLSDGPMMWMTEEKEDADIAIAEAARLLKDGGTYEEFKVAGDKCVEVGSDSYLAWAGVDLVLPAFKNFYYLSDPYSDDGGDEAFTVFNYIASMTIKGVVGYGTPSDKHPVHAEVADVLIEFVKDADTAMLENISLPEQRDRHKNTLQFDQNTRYEDILTLHKTLQLINPEYSNTPWYSLDAKLNKSGMFKAIKILQKYAKKQYTDKDMDYFLSFVEEGIVYNLLNGGKAFSYLNTYFSMPKEHEAIGIHFEPEDYQLVLRP